MSAPSRAMSVFAKATKKQARLRLALIGPSGSGKTFTALLLACLLGQRVALIDTERGSASKYADLWDFDVLELETFHPQHYIDAIHAAEEAAYEVLVIDSLSHAWAGREGVLEQHDLAVTRQKITNTFTAWKDVTPLHNALVDALIASRLHLIATMRAKTAYEIVTNEQGKTSPRKIGLAPVQRSGLEYEFDLVADMDLDNTLVVSKSRCPALSGAVIAKPGPEVGETLKAWLSEGTPGERRASAKQLAEIDAAIARLAQCDETKDWPELAEKLAKRDYKHGLAALTASEADEVLAKLNIKADELASMPGPEQEQLV